MRLINTRTFELKEAYGNPNYAILSHRWGDSEVTFQTLSPTDLANPSLRNPSLNKIRGACAQAREQKLEWLWIDTCCIDKANAVEETRSINAMFDWYRSAAVCYTYLHDVDASSSSRLGTFHRQQGNQVSEWFERGWTLQELLAPRHMEFYDFKWNYMGTRQDLSADIQRATSINKVYITGDANLDEASVATRLSWMAGRVTKEPEDIAYSMLGILNINMTPQYGEGEKAFMRLQKTLMEDSSDESIFAWIVPPQGLACYRKGNRPPPKWAPDNMSWGLLAPSPDCFKNSGDVVVIPDMVVPRSNGGYTVTQQGVQFQMSMKSGGETTNMFGLPRKEITLALNCWRRESDGKPTTIVVELVKSGDTYKRMKCNILGQKKGAKPGNNKVLGIDQVLTRPLTISQPSLPRLN